MYKRVLLKLSGEALSGNGQAFDPEVLAGLAKELKEIQQKEWNWLSLLVVVISFGERC